MYNENIYKKATKEKIKQIKDFCEDYKEFLSTAKTERLAVTEIIKILTANGFKGIDEYKTLKQGDKVYFTNKNKNVIAYILGKNPLEDGLRILGSHLDSPRLDLKPNPLYESKEIALFDTHYYGGIKKYQFVTIPMALHGVICLKDGKSIEIHIGEKESDPVVGISDLLPHLASKQMEKNASLVIEGENLDVIVGSIPLKGKEKDGVKENILKFFKEKYGILEEDFSSAEIEVVPSGKARDFGLDRSMIASYGHDDRVCAYASLRAITDSEKVDNTICGIFVDKEEIGSYGATGAQSVFFENTILALLEKQKKATLLNMRKCLQNSLMLSSDVNAGTDPIYTSAFDKNNSALLNYGIVLEKYTGARGKSGASDANPEYIAKVRNALEENGVFYQCGEMGKVDLGGGGTIAHISAKYNMEVLDAGIPVLNMHSPMEVVSKADVFETYLAYKAFVKIK